MTEQDLANLEAIDQKIRGDDHLTEDEVATFIRGPPETSSEKPW